MRIRPRPGVGNAESPLGRGEGPPGPGVGRRIGNKTHPGAPRPLLLRDHCRARHASDGGDFWSEPRRYEWRVDSGERRETSQTAGSLTPNT